jgi:hypothetical protein
MKEWTKEKKRESGRKVEIDLRVRSSGFFVRDEEKEIGMHDGGPNE